MNFFKKGAYFIILCSLTCSFVFGQNQTIDHCPIYNYKGNSELSRELCDIVKGILINPELSQSNISIANNTLKNEIYSDDNVVQVLSHWIIGRGNYHLGNKALALKHARLAYELLVPEIRDTIFGVSAISFYADLLAELSDIDQTLKLYNEGVTVLDSICTNPCIERFTLLNSIASVYNKLGKNKLVLETYKKALEETKGLDDKLWLSSAYNNLGFYYYNNKAYVKAYNTYVKAKKALSASIEPHILFNVNIDENIAHIYMQKAEYDKALLLYLNTSKIRVKQNKKTSSIPSDISQLHCYVYLKNIRKQIVLFIC